MNRNVLLTAALALAGFALVSADASAQGRRGGRGGYTPSYGGYGNQSYGNSGFGSGITIPGTNYTIPGTGYSGNNSSGYNNSFYGNNGYPYQSGYGSGQRYNNGQYYNNGQLYSNGQYYSTVPNTFDSTSGYTPQSSAYSPADTSQIAMLNVMVPMANAQVWLNDTLTTPQGIDRQFQSPPLDPAKNYTYTVKARWMEGDRAMEKTKDVKVEPGKTSSVSFR